MSFYDSDESKFDLIPTGIYIATIFNVTIDETKDPVKMSVQYKLENNRRCFQNFKFNDAGKKFLTWQAGVLGWNTMAKEKNPDAKTAQEFARAYLDSSKDLLGKKVELEMSHREWEGKTYESVKLLGFADETQANPPLMDSSEELPF